MIPAVRNWELVIVLAIAVSVRTIEEALEGSVAPATAIVRFVLAGVICWAAFAIVERLWITYSNAAHQHELEEYLRERTDRAAARHQEVSQPPSDNLAH